MFIRYTITPIILFIESFPADSESYKVYYSNSIAIMTTLIMLLEMIALFAGLLKCTKIKIQRKQIASETLYSTKNFSNYNMITIIIIILTVLLYLKYPVLLKNYSFILDSSLNNITGDAEPLFKLPFGVEFVGYTLGEILRFVVIQRVMQRVLKRVIL